MEAKDIRNRNRIRKILESKAVEEDGCDASELYIKKLFRLNPIARYEDSKVIEVGEYKWTFIAREIGEGTLQFELLADIDNNPRLKIYALNTIAIINHSDPLLTNCSDRFHSVSKAHRGYILHLERAREEGFLDPKDNVQVDLQIQMFGENVFQPLLVKKYRAELLLTKMHFVNMICSSFYKKTVDNLKSLIDDKKKWQSFRTFVEESDQISKGQMFWEEQDVIQKALVNYFFVDGIVTSPLLMEILYIGYTSINANSTTAKFVKIEEDRFGLIGVPSLFTEVVGREYKPISESIFREFCCMIVEMFALDWIFRHKIRGNFTQSELYQTEKKSRKKVKKTGKTIVLTVIPITPKRNDKCVEEMEQTKNDESIAAELNDLAINAGIEDHHAAGVSPMPPGQANG